MLLEQFAQNPDAVETHKIEIAAPCETVYRALWTADLGSSLVVKGLMALRSLPERLLHPGRGRHSNQKFTLQALIEAGFGRLAEDPGREIVLGVTGRFWRPIGNTAPFSQENFLGAVPPGLAKAVWNFTVHEANPGQTILCTETRVVCGDEVSRLKFRAYWFVVGPFSGLIRRSMLRAIRRACEGTT